MPSIASAPTDPLDLFGHLTPLLGLIDQTETRLRVLASPGRLIDGALADVSAVVRR